MIPSVGIRIFSESENMNLDLDNIADFKISDVSSWTVCQPRVLFSLHNDKKSKTDPLVFRTKFHEQLSDSLNYLQTVLRMEAQLDQPVLIHLIYIDVDCLTVPLFFLRRSKLLV